MLLRNAEQKKRFQSICKIGLFLRLNESQGYAELYLSFWDTRNGFFIKHEEELKNKQSQGSSMTMG